MTGAFVAARRRARKEPVEIPIEYVDEESQPLTLKQRNRETGETEEVVVTNTVEVTKTEVFVFRGEISSLAIGEMIAGSDVSAESETAIATVRDIYYGAFGDPLEYRRFFHFAQRHLDSDDLIDLIRLLIAEFTGRPTQPSGDWSDEPSPSGDDSKVVTLSGGFQVARAEEEPTGS